MTNQAGNREFTLKVFEDLSVFVADSPDLKRLTRSERIRVIEKSAYQKAVLALKDIANQDIMPSWELIDMAEKTLKELGEEI